VVLLLVYALVVARRRRADEDFYPEVAAEDTRVMDRPEPVVAAAAMDQDFADDQTLDEQRVAVEPRRAEAARADDLRAETARAEAERAETAEETGSETNDVIGEADIYIAYGRYPQAIGLLLGVLEENPGRNDVRLKLLELYAETRDRDAFDAHMTELLARCDDDEALLTARELAAQFGDEVPATSGTGNPGETLDEDDLDLDELAAQDESHGGEFALSEVKDFDADDNFDEVDDLEFDDAAASAAITGAADAQAPLGSEDFELELDDLAEDDAGSAEDTSHHRAGDSLGGDLGIDFDPERQRNGEEHADAEPEDLTSGDDLDLDLDDAEALDDDAFDFEDAGDTAGTKLDLARAYIDMGDQDGARDILNEVVAEGNSEQQQRAQAMLEEL
jgi:pilus assembly protein FimV